MAIDIWNFPLNRAGKIGYHTNDPNMSDPSGFQYESDKSLAKFPGHVLNKHDIRLAREQGASDYQMKQLWLHAGKTGVSRDTNAARQLWQDYGGIKSPWKFGNYGNWGMGMKDIYGMEGEGWNVDQVKGARDFAIQNRLNIGKGVDEHIQGLEQQALDAQILQQQEQLAQEQNELLAQIATDEAAAMQSAAEGAEAGRLASMRGGGSRTLSASGAATFKGKGLTSSENKRGKGRGTGQLRRPYGTSNLSIAATGKGNQQSTLNL